jgi:hypothetical protein
MTLEPVFVTVEPPRTAKPCAVPSGGARANDVDSPERAPAPSAPHPVSWKGRRTRRAVIAVDAAAASLEDDPLDVCVRFTIFLTVFSLGRRPELEGV